MKRIVLAASLVCAILFLWGGLSHMVLFIGDGFSPLPQEEIVLKTLSSSIPEKGLYYFPGKDFHHSTHEQETSWLEKFRTGPTGMIIYRPIGGEPFSPKKLLIQLLGCFVTALILSFIGSLMAGTYWKRVFAITLLGLMACSTVSIIYWNWYEFPDSFFIAQIADQVVGCFLAGLMISKVIPQPERKTL
jgi:hypothetical protein